MAESGARGIGASVGQCGDCRDVRVGTSARVLARLGRGRAGTHGHAWARSVRSVGWSR
jgi:hypothetical protein